jgi:hypothetical protein
MLDMLFQDVESIFFTGFLRAEEELLVRLLKYYDNEVEKIYVTYI